MANEPNDDPTAVFRPGSEGVSFDKAGTGNDAGQHQPYGQNPYGQSSYSPNPPSPDAYGQSPYSPGPSSPDAYGQSPYGPGSYGQGSYDPNQYGHSYDPAVYGQPPDPYAQQGYPPPYGQQPGYGYPQPAYGPAPTNGMAIAALICAFVVSPLGIVLGIMARNQIKQTGEGGDGLALAGIIIGAALTVLFVLAILVPLVFLAAFASSAGY